MAKDRRTAKKSSATSQTGDVVEHVSKAPCSVEFSRDAKGQPRWAIKLYGEFEDMDQVVDRIVALDSDLKKRTKGA